MKKQITRTVDVSSIYVTEIIVDGNNVVSKELEPVVVLGEKVKSDKAVKHIKNAYGKDRQLIATGIDVKQVTYALDLETFAVLAEVVEIKSLTEDQEQDIIK